MSMTKLSNEQRNAIIGKHIGTQQGRQKIASSMQQPLRERRDYSAVGRKTFEVEELPDGALPIYDKDPEVKAYAVSEEGENIVGTSRGTRVLFPLFELAANPEIPLSQIKERRFDLVERSMNLGKAQIQAAEDSRVFDVMDALAVNGFNGATPNPQVNVNAPITPSAFIDAFAEIEQWDNRVARVFMNARDFADLRRWGRDVLDIETQATLLKTGLMAQLHGAQIMISRIVEPGYIYVCAEPEFLGRFPVRTELTVLSADDPKARRIGFSIFEMIGIGAFNPKALARIKIAR
jgi:hypothetical protein